MEPKERVSQIKQATDLPSIDEIAKLSRGINWKFVFSKAMINEREEIGEKWKQGLPQFSIGIHTSEPIIQCLKLITNEEIIAHQRFFESCAQDYGHLSRKLILQLVTTKGIPFTPEFPLLSLNAYRRKAYATSGRMGDWTYYVHGFHYAFTHKVTQQHIEVPLTFGEEFGELDPYFFSNYILSSSQYLPLPIAIYDPFGDGRRILQVMQQIGKFEQIPSNIPGRVGVIVSDRDRKKIIVSEEGFQSMIQQVTTKRPFFNLWNRFLHFLGK